MERGRLRFGWAENYRPEGQILTNSERTIDVVRFYRGNRGKGMKDRAPLRHYTRRATRLKGHDPGQPRVVGPCEPAP